ncbi:Calcium-dependent protein kinase 31 [Raphanus sativus]|nr:Calcium-dependent protein kinase 31 [Raphanus sativus]
MNKLKKVSLKVMAKNLGNLLEEEIKGLKTMFNNIDTDKSGTVTHEEVKRGFTTLGSKVSETEVKQLIEAAIVAVNGTIDIEEFISATLDRFKLDHHELFRQEFQHFDKRKRWVNNKG